MLSPSPHNVSVYISIANTLDTLLSCHHPLIPWLAMRQSNHSPLRIGQTIGMEYTHGPLFADQTLPMYARICGISYFVQGFVIVMASVDPQSVKSFESTIQIAIPRQWISLPFLSAVNYRLFYQSLSQPRFIHLLKPSHAVHRHQCFQVNIAGSRTVKKVSEKV